MRELFNLPVFEAESRNVNDSDHLALVQTSAGLIRVTIYLISGGTRTYEMVRGESVGPIPLFNKIEVMPVEGSGSFVVAPTQGRLMPSADGAEVVINGEVNMTAETSVGLKSSENTVKIDPVANVVKLDTNVFQIHAGANTVKLDSNVMEIDATKNVIKIDSQQNTVKLNTDQIGIDPNKNLVRVDGEINVGTVSVGADSTVTGLPMVTTNGTSTQQFNTNSLRGRIYVFADADNAEPVWLGATAVNVGIPLMAGMGLEIPVKGTLKVYGVSGQKLYAMETE